MLFMEHPATKNWFPIHPLAVRSDGFVGYNYEGTIRFRGQSTRAAKLLEEVIVYINDEEKTARLVNLTNSVDYRALLFNLSRRYTETNTTLAETILKCSWFNGQTERKLRSSVSAALRLGEVITVAASASSFSIPGTATGVVVRNIQPWVYNYEYLSVSVSGTSNYRTVYASGELGCGYVRQVKTDFTNSSGVVTFDTYIDTAVDRPYIHWKIPYYTELASSVSITENFPHEVPDLIVYFPTKVDVGTSTESAIISFNRTCPRLKWSRFAIEDEPISGLSTFDF